MRPRENKHHVLFTKYGQPVHSPSSAVKQWLPSMPLPTVSYSFIGSGMEGSGC